MESGQCLVGISLGNTNTVVAYTLPDGRIEVIADKEGDRIIPFVISYMEDEIFHGIEAKKRIISNPASTHQRFRDSLDQESKFEDLKNHLIYLRSTAENFIGRPVDGCVIAVPHTFSSRNRTTLESVATVSGFRICQIVSEPVTSLLAYVSATPDIQYQKQLGLVIEFGGTACSVSLIHCFGGKFAVLGSNTSDELSGAHLDIILRDYLRGVFEKENGVTLDGLKALAKLEQEAEQARVTLSSSPKATISIDGIMGEIDFHTAVTRLRADMLFRQFYKDFASFVTGTLTSHGLTTKDVGLIALSGGLTNTPKVLSLIENLFPTGTILAPSANYDRSSFALEACARGAAAQASLIASIPSEEIGQYLSLLQGVPIPVFSEALLLQIGSKDVMVLVKEKQPVQAQYKVQFEVGESNSHLALAQGRAVTSGAEDEDSEEDDADLVGTHWHVTGKLLEICLSGILAGETVEATVIGNGESLQFTLRYKNKTFCDATL